MPYFLYGRRKKRYHSEFNGSGGGSQGDYCERDFNAKILKYYIHGSNVHDRRRSAKT